MSRPEAEEANKADRFEANGENNGACGGSQTGGEPASDSGSASAQQNDGRETASEYSFECTEDKPEAVENPVFNEDVTVSGEKTLVVECEYDPNM